MILSVLFIKYYMLFFYCKSDFDSIFYLSSKKYVIYFIYGSMLISNPFKKDFWSFYNFELVKATTNRWGVLPERNFSKDFNEKNYTQIEIFF
jgi:hypothetical protein